MHWIFQMFLLIREHLIFKFLTTLWTDFIFVNRENLILFYSSIFTFPLPESKKKKLKT